MKKQIAAGVLMILSATIVILGYSLMTYLIDTDIIVLDIILILCLAIASFALLLTSGILILVNNKFACYLSVLSTILTYMAMIIFVCTSLIRIWYSALFTLMNVSVILTAILPLVGLCLAPKDKGLTLAYFGMFLCACGGTLLVIITRSIVGGLAIGFAILTVLSVLLPAVAIARAIRGKSLSFELTILGLLFQAVQFLLICTFCGILRIYMLFGLVSILPLSIGGILIHNCIESGFVFVAFGIIIFFIWLALIWIIFGIALSIATILTVAGIITYISETISMRGNNAIKITKSI